MTKKERRELEKMLSNIAYPSVSQSLYVETKGEFKRKELVSVGEVTRRLDSTDYKLGWEACRNQVREWLDSIGIKEKKK